MIEQGFNYADSPIKKKTDILKTRVENLEPEEEKKKSSTAAKIPRNPSTKPRRGRGKTLTPVS